MKVEKVEDILPDIRSGKPIVLIDDKTRENEGDLVIAAEKATPGIINFMLQEGKGLVCLSITEPKREALGIPVQVQENTSLFGTNFAASFDHRSVAGGGVSAAARSKTILEAVKKDAKPADFVLPGHVFPVCAVSGGVLRRRGQTEGSVELARIAGLEPAGVICEIMGAHGKMLRGVELEEFCRRHDLRLTSVEEIVQYRLHHEVSLRRVGEVSVDAAMGPGSEPRLRSFIDQKLGAVKILVYVDDVDEKEHFAIVCGDAKDGCLVRIHSECLTGDVFSSRRCDCGSQFHQALEMILAGKSGILIYLHQEGRGIGLGNKLRAYELQDQGLDTVDANIHLGFAADSRNYRAGAQILSDLGLKEVELMTNNPDKVKSLESHGIKVARRVPLPVETDEFNQAYMLTKKQRLGHIFE